MKKVFQIFSHLPSWAWVFIFPLGIAAFIGTIIFSFYVLSHIEGVASLIFIFIGWSIGTGFASEAKHSDKSSALPAMMVGGFICFYALMGMAIDQTGNYFFNKPIEWWLCPAETTLHRGVRISHPLPERTDITQDFRCVNSDDELVKRPPLLGVIGIRFVEYVLVAYFFMGVRKLQLRDKPVT